jgi:hypothetical protein
MPAGLPERPVRLSGLPTAAYASLGVRPALGRVSILTVALAHARRSEEEHVAALFDEAQCGQLGHDGAVDRGLEVELEVDETLRQRVVREAQPAGQATGGDRLHLGRQEPFQDLHGGRGRRGGPLQFGSQALRGRRKPPDP